MEKLVEKVRRVEEVSERICRSICSKIAGVSKGIAILYCGNTRGIAQHLFTILKIAKPTLSTFYADADYIYNILLPYISDDIDLVIVFTDSKSTRCFFRILQASTLSGLDVIAVAHTLLQEVERKFIERMQEAITLIEVDRSIYRLTVLHTNLRIGLALSRGSFARIERISRELEIASTVKDLVERYSREIIMLKNSRTVMYTKSLLPLGEELREQGYRVLEIQLNEKAIDFPLTVIYTSAEEHIVNELKMEMARKGIRGEVADLRINTDPLTAPIYGHILLLSVGYKEK